jgi:long-chain fatty acid transport protein
MKQMMISVSALAFAAGAASAGGIDRSGQSIAVLFEKGRYVEFSLGHVSPSVSGNDVALFGAQPSGDVAGSYAQVGLGFKTDLNDSLSAALILDQPFGADVLYPVPGSIALGGTLAKAESLALTGLLRYKFNDSFSVHGGLRLSKASGNIRLSGAAYGALSGYNVDLADEMALGYVAGVAYEIPDIALRVALTYNSAIEHDFDSTETIAGFPLGPVSTTKVKTPESVNLDFQTGIAADTLLFGGVRWVHWSQFRVDPPIFTTFVPTGLIDLENTTTYTLGVGRKFTDSWSGAVSVSYEGKGDPLVSPLAPTNGRVGVTLAAVYTHGNMKITTGLNYTRLGDSQPETGTPDVARADFTDNDSLGVGVKVGFTF